MQLPGGEHAVIDIIKLRDYVLNPLHARGRHKARVFASVLHIYQADAGLLQQLLLGAASTGEAVRSVSDEYGDRYTLDFECIRGERRAMVRSAWIILAGQKFPRLTTCFVILD